jgi:hypothetical protein
MLCVESFRRVQGEGEKSMKNSILVLAAMLILACLAPISETLARIPQGAPADAPVTNPVTSTVKGQLARFSKNMVGAAEAMPADKYSFKPNPEMNTFGHLVLHILQTNNTLCSKAAGSAAPQVSLTETDPKEKLVAGLKASFDYCSTAMANVDDSKLGDPMTLFGNRPSSRAGAIIALSDGWFDHYSTQAIYLRLNGILPPSAQPAQIEPAKH